MLGLEGFAILVNRFKNKLDKYPLGKVHLDLVLPWSQGVEHGVFQSPSPSDLYQILY